MIMKVDNQIWATFSFSVNVTLISQISLTEHIESLFVCLEMSEKGRTVLCWLSVCIGLHLSVRCGLALSVIKLTSSRVNAWAIFKITPIFNPLSTLRVLQFLSRMCSRK